MILILEAHEIMFKKICFPVHPEQLPPRPWITLKERDQILPSGK